MLAFSDNTFILGEINKYYFIYHFYNWYTFKHNIAGIDAKSQELLNKYLNNDSDEDLKTIQLADIYKLKDAIKHDKAAIEFVFKLCQAYDSARKALAKVKDYSLNTPKCCIEKATRCSIDKRCFLVIASIKRSLGNKPALLQI